MAIPSDSHMGIISRSKSRFMHISSLVDVKPVIFQIAYNCTRPVALIHRELCETMEASIVVALYDEPRWSVTDPKIEDLASQYKLVQAIHELWYAGREVPPMDVKEIKVVGLKSL